MAKPKLLLMDEPSMGLAPKLVKAIFSIISEINAMAPRFSLSNRMLRSAPERVAAGLCDRERQDRHVWCV